MKTIDEILEPFIYKLAGKVWLHINTKVDSFYNTGDMK